MRGYDVFMVDPPWPITMAGKRAASDRRGPLASDLVYDTPNVQDIATLLRDTIFPLAARPHAVFLWATESTLQDAEAMMTAMSYARHIRLIWDKEIGHAPAFTVRWTHEYLVWFYKPRMIPVVSAAQGCFTSVIRGGRREHSRKPEAAYALVEALYPDAKRLDVFTREYRPGWDGWGDQRDHFTPLFAPLRESEVGA